MICLMFDINRQEEENTRNTTVIILSSSQHETFVFMVGILAHIISFKNDEDDNTSDQFF